MMTLTTSFANPGLLFSLLALPVCLAFFLYAHLRRRQCVKNLTSGPLVRKGLLLRPRVRRWKGLLFLIGLALLAIAAAGPQWGHDRNAQHRQGRDVIVVLDLSRSMNAEQPSRRQLAIRALQDLADTFEHNGGNRVALVGFAERARLFFPLTQDYDHLRHTLAQLGADDYAPLSSGAPISGTRIGAALKLAAQSYDPERVNRPIIVLISDGDDPADDDEWLQGVQEAKAKNLRVHTVGVGDPNRAETIPIGRDVLQFEGEPVFTKLQEARLEEIARRTDGIYLPAHRERIKLGAFVQHLLDADALRDESADVSTLPLPQLRYAWFLLPSLGFLVLAMFLNEGTRSIQSPPRRVASTDGKAPMALVALLAILSVSAADPPEIEALLRRGNEAFALQQYDVALRFYEQAEALTLDPGLVSFNKAAAYSRLEKYKEAIECYRRCLEDDGAPSARRARAGFDLGNALLRDAGNHAPTLAQAVQAYRACLREPDLTGDLRADARHNLELAQLLWLKARNDQKTPDTSDDEKKPPQPSPLAKNPLDQKDPGKSDSVYQPVDSGQGSQANKPAEVQSGHESKNLRSGSIVVLPDEEPIVPLAPSDTLATLDSHAQRIAEQRRRQRNPAGSGVLTTKDW
jgi:Ca-activated chloride channel family protein